MLQTAKEENKMKEIKPATKEEVAEQTKTIQKSDEEKKKDSKDELNAKYNELIEKEARINGGYSKLLQRNYLGIDLEMEVTDHGIQIKQIELEQFIPLTPYWRYELDERWVELQKKGLSKDLEQRKANLEKIKQQKEEIFASIPKLKKRINELEKELGDKITDFEVKTDK